MIRSMIKWMLIISILTITLIALPFALYTVGQNEIATITRFGKVINTVDKPGINIKTPIIDTVSYISKKLQHYDMQPSGVITKDKKSMICDNFVIWKITDPVKYIRTLNASQTRALERIEAAVYNAVKSSISSMNQEDVIASRGKQLTNVITKESNSDIGDYGIEIVRAEIKKLDLPDDNKTSVYERMISERQNIAAAYAAEGKSEAEKIRNKTNREVSIMLANAKQKSDVIIAEGEAEYMKTLQAAYDSQEKADFYKYIRGLDAIKKSLTGSNKTIILDKESDLVKVLYEN